MKPKCKHCSEWDNQAGCQLESSCPISDEPAIQTNGDRIRAMSNEELAGLNICPKDLDYNFVCNFRKSCGECLLDWLNSPADSEVK